MVTKLPKQASARQPSGTFFFTPPLQFLLQIIIINLLPFTVEKSTPHHLAMLTQPASFGRILPSAKQLIVPLRAQSRGIHALLKPRLTTTISECIKSESANSLKNKLALQKPFGRNFTQQSNSDAQQGGGNLRQRLIYGAGIFGATLVATNL